MNRHIRKKSFLCLYLLLVCFIPIKAQDGITVKGTVTDENKEPLIGVTVQIKGTTTGTITDIDGNYTLPGVKPNTSLTFTYIGYAPQTIAVKGKNLLNVVMNSESVSLDDVVVVGYGSQKKLSVTGSVSSVQSKDLARTTATTTAATLAGKVPGITFRQSNGQPGTTMKMEIRNMGTPLFIIDGVMKDEGQFNNLDINDIESISILKDGAAAIYGVKAANGVVLVTTKRGKLNEKPTVNINGYYGFQNWTRFPKFSNAYNYTRAWAEADINTNGVNSSHLTHDELGKWQQGYYDPATGEDYRSFDWTDFVVRKNAPQKYINVSSSGGSDKTNYYLSVSRMDQDASFRDFNFNRTNVQLNLDTKITKYIKVGASMNGRIESRNSPAVGDDYGNDFWNLRWGLNRNLPTERPYANDNEAYLNNTRYNINNQAYADRDIVGAGDDLWRVFQGNWDVEWKTPLKGLKVTALYSYYVANNQVDRSKKYVPFYTYDKATDAYSETGQLATRSLLKKNRMVWENMYRFSIDYGNKFGDHSVNAVLVAEATERYDRSTIVFNDKLTDNFQTLFSKEGNNVNEDYYNVVPTAGFIGRVNYGYRDKYLVEFSGRYDGSFKMSRRPVNKRWGFFPSVSAGWRISEENFFKSSAISDFVSNIKLRGSYGEMGDDDVIGIDNFDHLSGYTYASNGSIISSNPFASSNGTPVTIITQDGVAVTNVTWATASMSNIGIDLGFFNNRLAVEVDGFCRKRRGLTAYRAGLNLPIETGIKNPKENLNTDEHIGIDGLVKWSDHVGSFNYSVGVNATLARKKDGRSNGQEFGSSWDEYRTSTQNRWAYINWGYQVTGRFQSQEEIDAYPVIMNVENGSDGNMTVLPGDLIYKDMNGDGVINDLDRRPIGYAEGGLPYLTFGLNFAANWKNFDLTFDFAGGALQSFQQSYETKWPFQAEGNTFDFMVNDRWHHQDPLDPSSPWVEGYYPALRLTPTDSWNNYCSNSTYWLTNVYYLRLRNLEVGYTLPVKWTQKAMIQKCRFYFNGTNLFCLDNISHLGIDPENTDVNGLGYPNVRTLSFGLNITF